jgi:hypothetical protein
VQLAPLWLVLYVSGLIYGATIMAQHFTFGAYQPPYGKVTYAVTNTTGGPTKVAATTQCESLQVMVRVVGVVVVVEGSGWLHIKEIVVCTQTYHQSLYIVTAHAS